MLTFDEKIRSLELLLDLKEYYDIKRPTIVFFSNPTANHRSLATSKWCNVSNQQLMVTRYDILSETCM